MIETWFTSDSHFGHKNIIAYQPEQRPFSSMEEMHAVMIDRWNAVVKPKDIVWHLGDFCFGMQWLPIAACLNGRKKLVMGNHDMLRPEHYLKYFDRIFGVVMWKHFILSHIPVHPSHVDHGCFYNVHGHLHSKHVEGEHASLYINVCADANDLTPVHVDELEVN